MKKTAENFRILTTGTYLRNVATWSQKVSILSASCQRTDSIFLIVFTNFTMIRKKRIKFFRIIHGTSKSFFATFFHILKNSWRLPITKSFKWPLPFFFLGERGYGYKNSVFHRIVPGYIVQGGDFTSRDGNGQMSIYGGLFEDENFLVPHDSPGMWNTR